LGGLRKFPKAFGRNIAKRPVVFCQKKGDKKLREDLLFASKKKGKQGVGVNS